MMKEQAIYTVSKLNRYIKSLFQSDQNLQYVCVQGEISNFKNHSSGHWYFSLKDEASVIKAVMFRTNAAKVSFLPQNGMKVWISGYVSVYERDGAYQLYAEEMLVDGMGFLHEQYEKRKEKLAAEGLFDLQRKKALPKYPQKIGIATSPTGAAVRDIFSILTRRYPQVEIYFVPTLVQGSEAANAICASLDILYQSDVDVIIVGRGGGSIEDLWCFNEEDVVRKIANSPIPIISAVGHETDVTLSDFAADRRAATPSMAAELAVAVSAEIQDALQQKCAMLTERYEKILQQKSNQIELLKKHHLMQNPQRIWVVYQERLDHNVQLLQDLMAQWIEKKQGNFQQQIARLQALSPLNVLARGYSLCTKQGKVIKTTADIQLHDILNIQVENGAFTCEVKTISQR